METINYTWLFSNPNCIISLDGMSQIVQTIHWRLIGTQGEFTAQSYGAVSLPVPTNPDDYIPYEDLTEEWFIGQVESHTDITAVKENIAAQIELLEHPVMDSPPLPFIQ
jgi:hypothetical protein